MNVEKLKGHIPESVIREIEIIDINFRFTPLRLAHFLSQCAHESINFTAVYENLNYSAKALKAVFGKYFNELVTPNEYARKPEKIANRVYANRMGNGSESSGDGWKFRGRGYIQLTGKNNYKSFGDYKQINLVANPNLVATKYPLESAKYFFDKNNIWAICDKGSDIETITAVTKRVNGGTNGINDRINHFNEFYKLLVISR